MKRFFKFITGMLFSICGSLALVGLVTKIIDKEVGDELVLYLIVGFLIGVLPLSIGSYLLYPREIESI